ncbi:MAG TPA: ribosomal protein S18-alanine N-acetyltransferase [Gemmatimonadaceae bacterium]|nr:ribosomal protein S18-alanine N-acetyltransferase [Gemmatimonadaceae bacterium]
MPSDTLTIRRCVPTDLERVASIERASFSDPWSFETFSAALALRHLRFLVAEEGGRGRGAQGLAGGGMPPLVGYVVALVMADEGEIADVAVAPAARRRGVARVLMERMTAELMEEGVRALYLEVRESNVAARALYESLGFAQVGRRRGYYQHPSEDALLLRRDLGPD